MGSSERQVMSGAVDVLVWNMVERLRHRSRVWGSLPDRLREYLEGLELFRAQTIPWRRLLRLYVASSPRTFLKSTLARPSRRYGTTPGIRKKRHHEILVAIDTSGSVRREELAVFFAEIYHLWRLGSQVDVIECDAEITRAYPYCGKAPDFVVGRGGTSFDGPVARANGERRFDVLIYFTT